ncbi:hypothetical protein V3C99_008168 [Haemonchus contortus]
MAFTYQNPLVSQGPLKVLKASKEDELSSDNVTNYSAIAFLPVIMIGAVVLGICGVCQYKRWKHEKKQIAHLNQFYDIFEGAPLRRRKMVMVDHSDIDEQCNDRIRRAMVLPPTESSPFFQPTRKAKCSRFETPQKATTATEVIFHFANLSADSRKISIDGLSDSEIEHIV